MNKNILLILLSIIIFLIVFGTGVFWAAENKPAQTVKDNKLSQAIKVEKVDFVWERDKNYLGGGYALDPIQDKIIYVGQDGGLYAKDFSGAHEELIIENIGFLDVFSDPCISPDGKKVVFSVSGGTAAYPSNIYVINIDGSGLKQLTDSGESSSGGGEEENKSDEGGAIYYNQYFYSPTFSPDGGKILFWMYDIWKAKDYAGLLNVDGSNLNILTEGKPISWSRSGRDLYYSKEGKIFKLNLLNRKQEVLSQGEELLSHGPDEESIVSMKNGLVYLKNIKTNLMKSIDIPTKKNELKLSFLLWTSKDKLLLVYKGDRIERVEVVTLGGF